VKYVFGVCIFCPHFDILWFDIILHSVHSCRGFFSPKLNKTHTSHFDIHRRQVGRDRVGKNV
jgi:hypothetical protein